MKVFVYGTLLKGMSRSTSLSRSNFCGLAMIRGHLHDFGDFPGIIDADDRVYGELYDIDSPTLAELDSIEGYDINNPIESLYLRRVVDVCAFNDNSVLPAYAYFYNPGLLVAYRRITSGDYRRDKLAKLPCWYIAYGSNMSSQRLSERIGKVNDAVTGYLEGYSLVFNKQGNNNSAYANIKYLGAGYRCPFVAYLITNQQLEILDTYEGEPRHYVRLGMPFQATDSDFLQLGHIYIAHPRLLTNNALPTDTYLNLIRQGYHQHGFMVDF